MKKTRKILSMLLTVCMIFTGFEINTTAQAQPKTEGFTSVKNIQDTTDISETVPDKLSSSGSDTVSRIDWLEALTNAFGFSVEEENYADNYYSDIDSSSEKYYAAMLATEFGLIDVEAGDPLLPNADATREFVSHSLNMCMGIQLQENESGKIEYTFDEAEAVTYPDDIQIAINQGWFSLDGTAFLPENSVTLIEADALIEIAKDEVESRKIDTEHENSYNFADDVTVLDSKLQIELTDDEEYTINGICTIKEGTKIGFIIDEVPMVKKVISLETNEEKTIIKTESVPVEEAFTELDIEGSSQVNLSKVIATCNNVEKFYILGGTESNYFEDGEKVDADEPVDEEEISAVKLVQSFEIPNSVKKDFDLGEGTTAYIEATVYDTSNDHKVSLLGDSFVAINAKVRFTCNVSMDVLKAIGVEDSIQLASVPISGIGRLKIALELQLEGDINLNLVENLRFGIKYSHGKGISTINTMKKESFSIVARIKLKAGVKASIGIDIAIFKGSIYAKVGAQSILEISTYPSDSMTCTQFDAWLYAAVGGEVTVDLPKPLSDIEWNKELTIFDKKNSPIKVSFHYENGKPVNHCTKEDCTTTTGKIQNPKYYTPVNSSYGYNGGNGGNIGTNNSDDTSENFTYFDYEIISETKKTIRIIKYNGNISALTIPSEIDGYTVKEISSNAFQKNSRIISVTIPDTVERIESSAFKNCSNLSYVKLPENENYTAINSYLFLECGRLNHISIPNSVTFIDRDAFYNCSNLNSITLSNGLISIGSFAFYGCTSLEEVVLPDSLTTLEGSVFNGCSNLKTLILSKKLTKMGSYAFNNCTSLTKIEIPKSLTSCSRPFSNCRNLKTVSFEEGITQIPSYLFSECNGISEITIPTTVTDIDSNAFYNCSNLNSITLSDGLISIGSFAFYGCTSLEEVVLPDSLTTLEGSVFNGCSNLKSLILSKKLTTMGYHAFADCTSLTKIEIPKSLTSCSEPFSNCRNLKTVSFEEGIAQIPSRLFSECNGISEITIPGTVTAIGSYAFYNCSNLNSITLSDELTSIGSFAFYGCTSLEKVVLPDSLTTLDSSVFRGCSNLKNLILSKNLTKMGSNVFADCTSLTKIEIPKSLTSCSSPFSNCISLKTASFEEGMTQIPAYLFSQCNGLSEIIIPSTVTTIGSYAFYNCSNLSKVILPYSIETIGSNAFANDTALTDLYIPERATNINSSAFNSANNLTLCVVEDSYAHKFATEKNIPFKFADAEATELTINKTEVSLEKDTKKQIYVTINPVEYMGDVVWTSSDESIATVDKNGVISGVGEGEAVITAKTANGTLKQTCVVTVTAPAQIFPIGDVNQDSQITAEDALAVLKYVVGLDMNINPELADCDGNSSITAEDALWILKKVVGLIP